MTAFKKKFIGDRAFYRMVILLIVPMIVQQGVTSLVSLLDNVMVGALGTEPMSGVAITNQLIFVYNLTIFGGLSGASIFGAQYYGVGDHEGMRRTMRFKLMFGAAAAAAAIVVFLFFGDSLVGLFLDPASNTEASIAATLGMARGYLRVMLWGIPPFTVVQVYSSSLRESGETVAPMKAGICAVFVNLVFNYLFIFGKFGFPRLGVVGAALATVLSRYVEMLVVVLFAHRSVERFPFMKGLYRSLYIPAELVKSITRTGAPLLLNEVLWSLGTTFINQSYSTRGLTVVAAVNINSTCWQLFCVVMFSMGSAVSILVGQKLGANRMAEARDIDNKLIFSAVVANTVIGLIAIGLSRFIPLLYNTEPEVRLLAAGFLAIAGASLPLHAFIHTAYFTIRSGGNTIITLLFDSVYTWLVPGLLAFFLCRMTAVPITLIFFAVQFSDAIKLAAAVPLLRSGFWAKNLIHSEGKDG